MPGDVVVLVHGIRTRAPWYSGVEKVLSDANFVVARSNYGRLGVLRFLIPIPFLFRIFAAKEVERDIREAMKKHKTDRVSIIAHSFGTYLITWLLQKRGDLKFKTIIFCGSVVKYNFPFQYFGDHFDKIVNDVGTADVWPVLAEIATWGYGSTGSYGINRPGILDRYHRGYTHSMFLREAFCRDWWLPVLKGDEPKAADDPVPPPSWLRFISVLNVKYLALALLIGWGSLFVHNKFKEPPFMLATVRITCRAETDEKPPQGERLLVMIHSDEDVKIRELKMNLQQMGDARPKEVNEHDEFYDLLISKARYKKRDETTQESQERIELSEALRSAKNWTAYTVPVKAREEFTQFPLPASYQNQYDTRIYVVMAGNADSDQPENEAVSRQPLAAPLNKHLLEIAELTIKAGEPVPESQVTVLDLHAIPIQHNCWQFP